VLIIPATFPWKGDEVDSPTDWRDAQSIVFLKSGEIELLYSGEEACRAARLGF